MANFYTNNLYASFYALIFALLVNNSNCYNPNIFNVSNSSWSAGGATWYGSPTGAGSTGGACGYTDAVERPPYSSMVSAGGSSIYQKGVGCGVCYQVKCMENGACSGNPVTVTITDECPVCASDKPHFDLSGTSFGAMAKPCLANQLRNAGVLNIQFQRVKCNYPGVTVAVKTDPGSNPYYIAIAIEYVNGEGLQGVNLKQSNGYGGWMHMERSWGGLWKMNAGYILQPPLSLQLIEAQTKHILTLNNIIPRNWIPSHIYRSLVNFH
ncbi:unnamed protein product [Amaranthus hypochondriacus]